MGILIVVGSITLYKTFALYKEEKTFNVLRGRVPSFVSGDLELAITMDGESINTLPSKGAYDVSITCDKGAEGYWDYEEWGPNIRNINEGKVKCTIEFFSGIMLNNYIISLSGTNAGIEKIDHASTEQTPSLTDYRYVGSNPDNYIYFGCSENCTNDNLYRVIGVIPTQSSETGEYENRVKLIKADFYIEEESGFLENATNSPSKKGYRWNKSNGSNIWEISPLNTDVLNTVFWNTIKDYQQFIGQAKWYLGAPANNQYSTYTAEQFYNVERSNISGKSGGNIYFLSNIGLMYPSDYAFSIEKNYWFTSIYNSAQDYINKAWLYLLEEKYYEWTISPEQNYVDNTYGKAVWGLYPNGYPNQNRVMYSSNINNIRPTFYLKSDVQYQSGDGTIENPYRIVII